MATMQPKQKLLQRILLSMIERQKGGFAFRLYRKLYHPNGLEYAQLLKRTGRFHHIGENVEIIAANITDPAYVSIGDNVTITSCTILGHDGVIRVLNNAYGKRLDSVGKVEILDNCFIGHGSIIMPGVKIGPNSVVAAGSVVTRDVAPGDIVGGVPSKPIGRMDDLVRRLEERSEAYPWIGIIKQREGAWDEMLEAELVSRRVAFFFKDQPPRQD
jgi:acetyltransferase-like isoleucine patch superfamily enzyme